MPKLTLPFDLRKRIPKRNTSLIKKAGYDPKSVSGILLSKEEIQKVVTLLAKKITKDYKKKQPILLTILDGSLPFTADLLKHLNFPLTIKSIKASSYINNSSSGKVSLQKLSFNPKGKDILIIEDIVDTGLTMKTIINNLKQLKPKSLSICSLLYKPGNMEIPEKSLPLSYVGFIINKDHFVKGYGLDDENGEWRNTDFIAVHKL